MSFLALRQNLSKNQCLTKKSIPSIIQITADFNNLNNQLTFENVDNYWKLPNNSTQKKSRIPKRIPKEFPKKSQKIPPKIPRFWKYPISCIILSGRKPIQACYLFYWLNLMNRENSRATKKIIWLHCSLLSRLSDTTKCLAPKLCSKDRT